MKKLCLLFLMSYFILTSKAQTLIYAIDCGGNETIGNFTADQYGSGGGSWSLAIFHAGYLADTTKAKNPAPAKIYTSGVYGADVVYSFPNLTANTEYIIRLHFADDYTEAGKRVQHILINGDTALKNYDIFASVGQMVADVKEFKAKANVNGVIKTEFVKVVDNAWICGIEIIKPAAITTITAIDCGNNKTVGKFSADQYGTGGAGWSLTAFHPGYSADTTKVTDPAPKAVYTTGVYGSDIVYAIPALVAKAEYTVRLHFADDYNQPGKRVQHILINGDTALKNYDIFASVGQMAADIKEFKATADDKGIIKIELIKVVDNAWICGIEILGVPAPCTGQTITLSSISKKKMNSADFVLKATTTSGLVVKYSIVSGPATITNDSIIHLNGTAGTVVVAANQAGNATYCPAPEATTSFYVSDKTFIVYAVDCGGNGKDEFEKDNYFIGGNTWGWADALITGITDPAPVSVLKAVRYGNFQYVFRNLNPLNNYQLRLHFVDDKTQTNQRLMNVYLNNTKKLADFDIFANAGVQYQCVVKEFNILPTDSGTINIKFETLNDNACVNAIEIIDPSLVGVQSMEKTADLNMYPNPLTSDVLTIEFSKMNEYSSLEIVDICGKSIYNKSIQSNSNKIFLQKEFLNAGVYFVKFSGNNKTTTHKLVIQ